MLGQLLEQRGIRVRLLFAQDPQPHASTVSEDFRRHLQVQVCDHGEGVFVWQAARLFGLGLRRDLTGLSLRGINGVNGRWGGEPADAPPSGVLTALTVEAWLVCSAAGLRRWRGALAASMTFLASSAC